MSPSFVHLNVHSEFSLVDSVVRIKPLIKRLAEQGTAAVALTDQSNLFALVKFYGQAIAAGIKPIVGCDLWLANAEDGKPPHRLTLLCKDNLGYKRLCELISRGYLEGQHLGLAVIQPEWLEGDATQGLIALSGGTIGELGAAAIRGNDIEPLLERYQRCFPDSFYLEVHRVSLPGEDLWLKTAMRISAEQQIPLVATNPVRFLESKEFDTHEARVCIRQGRVLDDPRRNKDDYSDEQYLRSPEEMQQLFSDLPEALQNSVEIAKRCNVELQLGTYFLPDFPIPDGLTIDEFLRQESHKGLEDRLDQLFGDTKEEKRKEYTERLDFELDVIIQMGFPGYFLIVADFIQWSKRNDIPVGPGRGSGAGSLVAYALLITDLDPLEYDLLFERFLNPERVSMPDFDVDFCMDGRDRVIDYVSQKYGRDHVSQIITYGTMAAKAVVRDTGRVQGHPFGFVDRVAKLIPPDLGMTLPKALDESEELKQLYERDEEVAALLDLAMSLEGLARNAGKHAGGVVIGPTKLTDFAPLYCEEDGTSVVTQFDKDDVEKVGLVKFDFLGLRTLTIIDWAVKRINVKRAKLGEEPLDVAEIPLDNADTFKLLKAAQTTAVFQLESRGMKELIKRLLPDSFEDIVALVALFRPGPLQSGMVDDFIDRKHGREKVSYPHPDYDLPALEPVLKPTYGIILYQEQVMQISQVLAGYSLGEADLLRRAMGKKKPEEMEKQRVKFTAGAVKLGLEEETATFVFDLMEKFAGYGFNKSHSAAYALLSYQTAWLKHKYPSEFMSAVLSADMDNTEKVVGLIDDCREMQLTITTPNINQSVYQFSVGDNDEVIYGLGAIKGVGQNAIEDIIEQRKDGQYKDLFDVCRRIDLRKVNRRVFEALIRGGALDSLGETRATLIEQLPDCLSAADQEQKAAQAGQNDLFGGFDQLEEDAAPALELPQVPEWPEAERLRLEKQSLGLYLTGHPFNAVRDEAKQFTTGSLKSLLDVPESAAGQGSKGGGYGRSRGREVTVAGLLIDMRVRNGNRANLVLDDNTGRLEVNVFTKVFEEYKDILKGDELYVIKGSLRFSDFIDANEVAAKEILTLSEARVNLARRVLLRVDARHNAEIATQLQALLAEYRGGGCPVFLDYSNEVAKARLEFGADWQIRPEESLMLKLREWLGADAVRIDY